MLSKSNAKAVCTGTNASSTLPPIVEKQQDFLHFPTRMQAFLFRNWDIVPKERIAACLGCSVQEAELQAFKLGLTPQKDVSKWLTQGYISIIKANWSLLPYHQLLGLLGWSEEQFEMVLKDEDFLKFKLGDLKPYCEPIEYRELTVAEEAATAEIKKIITESFVPVADSKEPFVFLAEMANAPFQNRPKIAVLFA